MYLGLDLGTSELKALLLNNEHRVVATARSALEVDRPQPLWAEQQPADWWRAVESVMDHLKLRNASAMRSVRAIGLSGQMHGAVLLDGDLQLLRPAMLWNDGRSHAECDYLNTLSADLIQTTGNLAMPGFTAPKVLWLKRHEPEIFHRIAKVILPKDYLRLRLTGEVATDRSDAAGTLFMDVGRRCWSESALTACGLDMSHMPALLNAHQAGAMVSPHWTHRFGFSPNVIVAGGAGDNAASGVGLNAIEPGQGFISLGTSGVVFAATDRFAPNPSVAMHAFCHALPGRWNQMSVMLCAASCVSWAKHILGLDHESTLLDMALKLPLSRRERAPQFMPYLSGERTPHNNTQLAASWFGMRNEHTSHDLAYAVVEGVCMGLLDGFETLSTVKERLSSGLPQVFSVVGGGSRSVGWVQLLASTLNLPLSIHSDSESCAALGAARLAWMADGGSVGEVCHSNTTTDLIHPDPKLVSMLMERRATFLANSPARETETH